jgi:hypothetical protein
VDTRNNLNQTIERNNRVKIATILQTQDYNKFCKSRVNRSINESALKKMEASMKKHGWLIAYPMHVVMRKGKLVIIDGQHRFTIASKLGIPAIYVLCEDSDLFELTEINVAQKPWNHVDFAKSYHNQGNVNYTKLIDFSERFDLPLGISAKLLMDIQGGRGTGTHEIREGRFKVTNQDNAEIIAGIVNRLKPLVSWASNSSFVAALMRSCSVNGFDPARFIQRCEQNPGLLILQATLESFLELIEKIYNYRSSQENKLSIKFEAIKR